MPVALRVRAVRDLDEYRAALGVIGHYFAWQPAAAEVERLATLMPLERVFAAFDGDQIVGGCGAYPLELTIPGGRLPCAGVTVVGVLPTHRRQGVMTRLMRSTHRDVRERGEPLAGLWASEETIYGRYGYGLATVCLQIRGDREGIGLRAGLPDREGRVRMVDHEEALVAFPRIYERVRRSQVGSLRRSRDWWEIRKLDDDPERRRGGGPLNRVLLELDGEPAGYALYRVVAIRERDEWRQTVRVIEAVGVDPRATREIWRFLLSIDWMNELEVWFLPLDHPLLQIVAHVNELHARLGDGLWLRLMDVPTALAARSYATDGRVTIEVASDPIVRENVGTWTIEGGSAQRSTRRADVRLDIQALAAVFLGGTTLTQLAAAERVEEVARGGLRRADALFRTSAQPWCPETF